MSKGPGRWQRIILEALESGEEPAISDLLPEGSTRSDYQNLMRAARKLNKQGKVGIWFTRRDVTTSETRWHQDYDWDTKELGEMELVSRTQSRELRTICTYEQQLEREANEEEYMQSFREAMKG